jgi:hypothetical protein
MLVGAGTSAHAGPPKTLYDHIQDSWAFGEISVIEPLTYRDGGLYAFPGRITELIHARYGHPRSILVVYEVVDPEDPLPFDKGTTFVAPLRVLPRTKYWRDNLPNSPRHEVLGGRRYVFKGDDAAAVKVLGAAWAATLDMGMPDRKLRQGEIVSGALDSEVKVLMEDSVRFLTGRTLTHITEKATTAMLVFASSDAPEELRVGILEAVGRAGLEDAKPVLKKLGARADATGAAALRAQSLLGVSHTTAELVSFGDSKSDDVRAWAYGELAKQSGSDKSARSIVAALLESDAVDSVRIAACNGLGRSGSDGVISLLAGALLRGDGVSRTAAMALAEIGTSPAIEVLKGAIREGPSEATIGSVLAMLQVSKPCSDCKAFLVEQHKTHDEGAIRDLIAIVMQFDSQPDD